MPAAATAAPPRRVRVWDLPTRLFHWVLVASMIGSFVTIKIGGNLTAWHFRFGYLALTLVLFRLAWLFVGGRYARLGALLPRPGAALDYLRGRWDTRGRPGHNPLGSLSVIAMLASVGFQAVSGLFSNDDIADEGPLVKFISKDASDFISGLHHLNEYVMIVLVATHLAAVLWYRLGKRTDLVGPMMSGDKLLPADDPAEPSRDSAGTRLLALVVLAVSAALVTVVVQWPAPTY